MPSFCRSRYLVVEQVFRLAFRENIKLVRRGCASGEQEFAEPDTGRSVNRLGRDVSPYLVKKGQPVEEFRILNLPYVPVKRLIEVVMRVHETRQHYALRGVYDPCACRFFCDVPGQFLANEFYLFTLDVYVSAGIFVLPSSI